MRSRALLLAALLAAAACAKRETPAATAAPAFRGAPVIVISIDTLRADRLPAYGYRNLATPHLDALRDDSILFRSAWSHVPLTLPSHVAMLTGTLPPDNGVRNNLGYRFDASRHDTIPAMLRRSGYSTGAVISAYVLRGDTGLREAFDFYDDALEVRGGAAHGELQRPGGESAAIAQRWIEQQGSRPFFLMLHLFEPHTPYAPPEPFASRYRGDPYDGEIAAADAIVGRFIAFLKQKGIYDRAAIVLMSDHGEGLGDHGEEEHGIFLYREALQIPLMLKLPDQQRAKEEIARPVGLIDLLPTIAAITGSTPNTTPRGTSLIAAADGARSLYAETLYPRIHLGWSELRSLIGDTHHLIAAPRPELFDLAKDPAEKTNVIDAERRTYAAMRKELDAYGTEIAGPANIDPEEARKLAALGYLSATSSSAAGPLPDPKDRIGDLIDLRAAAELEERGNVARAIERYRAVLERNPSFTDAWVLLARAQQSGGQYDDAIASYRRAIALSPSLASEHALSIAALYLNLDRLDDAAKHADLAMTASPVAARVLLGRVALARRDAAGAASSARAALALQRDDVQARVLLAQALTAQGRKDEALQVIEEVAREGAGKPPVALVDFVRGDLLVRAGRVEEAKAAFRSEIRNFPAERQAYANLAVIQILEGKPREAEKTMDALVRAVPQRESFLFAAKTFEEIGAAPLAAKFRARAQ